LRSSIVLFATLIAIPFPGAAIETREKKPTPGVPSPRAARGESEEPVARSLQPFFGQSGPLSLSVDALGTTLPFGTVEVNKPDGGTVEAAFLVAATGGHDGSEIGDGEVRVDGRSVLWDQSIPNVIGGWNALADVTDLLRPKLDAAAPGRIPVEVSEENSDLIDGVVLAVVFRVADDATSHDVRLYFGSHGPSGNGFTIELGQPADAATQYNLGVGISYGLQTTKDTKQYTVIDVNGRRLTGSAGGPDDGSPSVGALITVGGLEDNSSNPPDAVATPVNLASDDEYYDLTPFIRSGDTRIEISTANPSKDDNLFFASFSTHRASSTVVSQVSATSAFMAGGTAAGVVGGVVAPGQPVERLVLAASAPRGAVGSEGEITATVLAAGAPLPDVEVELKIVSGPHAGATSRQRTNQSGNAKFLYRGASKGTDLLVAVVNMGGTTVAGSNVVLYEWTEEVRAFIAIEPGACPASVDARMQDAMTVALLGTPHFNVSDVDAASLHLENAAPIRMDNQDLSQPGEGADCPCSREGGDGIDDLVMFFRIQDVFPDVAGITTAQTRELTLSGRFKNGSSFEATNCVVISSSPKTTTLESILVPTEEGLDNSDG
jgi:hypothetical protein